MKGSRTSGGLLKGEGGAPSFGEELAGFDLAALFFGAILDGLWLWIERWRLELLEVKESVDVKEVVVRCVV